MEHSDPHSGQTVDLTTKTTSSASSTEGDGDTPTGPLTPGQRLRQSWRTWVSSRAKADWAARVKTLSLKLQDFIEHFDLEAFLQGLAVTLSSASFQFYQRLVALTLGAYFFAQMAAVFCEALLAQMNTLPPDRGRLFREDDPNGSSSFNEQSLLAILSRNLFNSVGAGDEHEDTRPAPDAAEPIDELAAEATKSELSFTLVGIVLMEDPKKSIATLEDKSAALNYPLSVDDEILKKLKVLAIEPNRLIVINLVNHHKEFFELNPTVVPPGKIYAKNQPTTAEGGIEKTSATQFSVGRTEVDNAMKDMTKILSEARAVPNFKNGVAAGYKLLQIAPGSIYEKLGLKNGDVITGLNGKSINDPKQAFDMLNEFKTASHLELQVEPEGGTAASYSYDIH